MINQNKTLNHQVIKTSSYTTFDRYLGYLHVIEILVAFFGNTASFFIFRFNKSFKKISSLLILSFAAILDNFAVVTWNFDHFLKPNFGTKIEKFNLFTCKLFIFLQYFSLQSNGLLLTLVIIDRYITVCRLPGSSKLPSCSLQRAFTWSVSIITSIFFLNFHILILYGYQHSITSSQDITDSSNSSNFDAIDLEIIGTKLKCDFYSSSFNIGKYWGIVHLVLYSLIPSTLMIIFISLLIHKTFRFGKILNPIAVKTFKKKRKVTINLIVVSTAFIMMTLPSSFYYAFIYGVIPFIPLGKYFEEFFDLIQFSNHGSIFFWSILINSEFRKYFLRLKNASLQIFRLNKCSQVVVR